MAEASEEDVPERPQQNEQATPQAPRVIMWEPGYMSDEQRWRLQRDYELSLGWYGPDDD